MTVIMIALNVWGKSAAKYIASSLTNMLITSGSSNQTNDYDAKGELHSNSNSKILMFLSDIFKSLPHYFSFFTQVHMVLFFWEGKFFEVVKRITRIRYVRFFS